MVCKSNDASSLQWPVVIFASCISQNFHDISGENREYIEYLSKSRAITKLIVITTTYGESAVKSIKPPPAFETTTVDETFFLSMLNLSWFKNCIQYFYCTFWRRYNVRESGKRPCQQFLPPVRNERCGRNKIYWFNKTGKYFSRVIRIYTI